MPPIVHIVRHAEGFHNSAKWGECIHDPLLTEKGKEQARELCQHFPYHDDIDLLMASPMKRTIQTCQLAFAPEIERGMRILLMPLAQESSDEPMDTGSSTEELESIFGDLIQTQRLELHPHWNKNVGQFDVTAAALIDRARKLRNIIRKRPEKNIVLVTHGAFAHSITGNITAEGKETTRMWANAECRTFHFVGDDGDAQLVETKDSRTRRPSLSKEGGGYLLSVGGPRKNSMGDVFEEAGAPVAVPAAPVPII